MPEYTINGITARADMIDSLQRYIDHGEPKGSFLKAVLCNNLKEACIRADDDNAKNLYAIVGWLYNEAPSNCWGSLEKYESWISEKRKL